MARRFHSRMLLTAVAATLLAGALVLAGVYAYAGTYGLNVLLRRGGSLWITVAPDDPRLSAAMRLALRDPFGQVEAAPFAWRAVERGFDVAELPVIADGAEVDRIFLARVDPARFRFVVRNAPAGDRQLNDWMEAVGAALVINGRHLSRDGSPDTPFVSAGVQMGPRHYEARHGVFVASPAGVRVHDLAGADWRAALRGAEDAMVSYPLLVAADGSSRVTADRRWLANRSFVGQDRSGMIIFGTTADAFFSLDRLAQFLRQAPLELTVALNLDGGPVACQGIALNGFSRNICGQWE